MFPDLSWRQDWSLGLMLTVSTVVIHVIGLSLIYRCGEWLARLLLRGSRGGILRIAVVLAPLVAAAFLLHALEAMKWASAYVVVGALETFRGAVLYSFSAMTTYGHAPVFLASEWQLLGAIQALNGMLTFGMTVAFLAALVRRVWPAMPL
ncbi:hypothetical protein [Falsiroseomonas oryzae]|uniref:hypothetical protein n=1 Tax=Falsiroseomonas oryzae TaxID=2766473 RepID=UPI0022EAC1DA|nr:hypothetical protein [Roseomonas sp. MO-31]